MAHFVKTWREDLVNLATVEYARFHRSTIGKRDVPYQEQHPSYYELIDRRGNVLGKAYADDIPDGRTSVVADTTGSMKILFCLDRESDKFWHERHRVIAWKIDVELKSVETILVEDDGEVSNGCWCIEQPDPQGGALKWIMDDEYTFDSFADAEAHAHALLTERKAEQIALSGQRDTKRASEA